MHYQTYAVVGSGVVGGLYGAVLQQTGAKTSYLAMLYQQLKFLDARS